MDFTDEYNDDCLAEIARRAKHLRFTVNDWADAIVLRDRLLDLGHDPGRGLLLIVTTHLTERELI